LSATSRTRAWLEIVRLPALFTAPGDVLAGWFLVGGGALAASGAGLLATLAALVGSSLCLYSAGMIMNDVADVATDARERPRRPIPSGRISRRAAGAASALLLVAGVSLAATAGTAPLAAAGLLAGLVLLYDLFAKRVGVLGPLAMGSCRGANLFLGASAGLATANALPVVVAASALAVYIACVTAIASRETEGAPGHALRWLPPVALAVGLAALLCVVWTGEPWVPAVAALPVALAFAASARLRAGTGPREVQRLVGSFLGALIPLQAAFVIVGRPREFVAAGAVLALWPLKAVTGRYISAS